MADLFDEHLVTSTSTDGTLRLTPLSFQSLFIVLSANDQATLEGTGFVVQADETAFLVTNWHLVTGRNPDTGDLRDDVPAPPDSIRIYQNSAAGLGQWVEQELPLYVNGEPAWLEHPTYGSVVDVVVLPLPPRDDVVHYPYGIRGISGHGASVLPTLPRISAGDVVFIPGFPQGRSLAGQMAILSRGSLASDLAVNVYDLPLFMIDARTREGQSGSPVAYYHGGGFVPLDDGRVYCIDDTFTWLLGVYSGRVWRDSDLGHVWKASVIADIIDR